MGKLALRDHTTSVTLVVALREHKSTLHKAEQTLVASMLFEIYI